MIHICMTVAWCPPGMVCDSGRVIRVVCVFLYFSVLFFYFWSWFSMGRICFPARMTWYVMHKVYFAGWRSLALFIAARAFGCNHGRRGGGDFERILWWDTLRSKFYGIFLVCPEKHLPLVCFVCPFISRCFGWVGGWLGGYSSSGQRYFGTLVCGMSQNKETFRRVRAQRTYARTVCLLHFPPMHVGRAVCSVLLYTSIHIYQGVCGCSSSCSFRSA